MNQSHEVPLCHPEDHNLRAEHNSLAEVGIRYAGRALRGSAMCNPLVCRSSNTSLAKDGFLKVDRAPCITEGGPSLALFMVKAI